MTLWTAVANVFVGWANVIAALLVDARDRMFAPKIIRMVERPDGEFLLYSDGKQPALPIRFGFQDHRLDSGLIQACRGSRIEIVLSARNFIFRTLELPLQASEFVEGIVRAQIDR